MQARHPFSKINYYKAVIKIKIPREIERRNGKPGMDLYDYVVALYEDRILILKREDGTVLEKQIPLKEFKGVRIYQNLLKGGYTIFSARGSISFPFKSVSLDLFRKLTNLVLERVKSQVRDISSLPVTETAPESMLLINMLHDTEMKLPDIRVGAVQKSADVHRKGATQNMIERMLWGEMNPEALHLYTDQYLIVFENGVFPNHVGMQDFGYTQTIIPLDRIDGIEVAHSEEYSLLEESRLTLGQDRIAYHFEIDNEEVSAFYNELK
ncbi:MAG: hypothetical protein UHU21_04015 [Lachnospiraceae bacterium]|nr:hypothetical protein [Lachnospiraceae bacterium]